MVSKKSSGEKGAEKVSGVKRASREVDGRGYDLMEIEEASALKKIGIAVTSLNPVSENTVADDVAGPTNWALGDQ